jgi:5-methyltetrahydrofolate--homocysteine methyltransferase
MKVIALCMSDAGIPQTLDDRMKIADELVNGLLKNNIAMENIFLDPLVQPLSVNDTFGLEFINAIEKIMTTFTGIHTACGLSNISYGLPERKFLNQTFMVMAVARGLDGAIVNPLDKKMMANIIAAETLMGRDEFCTNYLQAYRSKQFEV